MAWEPPEGIHLDDAFYDVMKKVTNSSWNRFARSGLRLGQDDMDDIETNYRQNRKEQKYKMCRVWQENAGANASVDYLYATLNHFLFPDECPSPVPSGKRKHEAGTAKPTGPKGYTAEACGPQTAVSDAVGFQGKSGNVTLTTEAADPPSLAEFCEDIGKMRIAPSTREFVNAKKSLRSTYKMTGKNGNVLIINNSFKHNELSREGSEVDVRNMRDLWQHLGCKVAVEEDLFGADIMTVLKDFCQDSKGYDYCTAVIMSHGGSDKSGQDFVLGEDLERAYTKSILEMFDNKRAPHLQEIPKLFFFQSCRGNNKDEGVGVVRETKKAFTDTKVIVPGAKVEACDASDAGPDDSKLPTSSDMLIAYATQLGDQAFRHTSDGSWFINAIANVFMSRAKDEHVLDLMVEVNDAVAQKAASQDGAKEMSHIEFSLRRKLYLFPGFN